MEALVLELNKRVKNLTLSLFAWATPRVALRVKSWSDLEQRLIELLAHRDMEPELELTK